MSEEVANSDPNKKRSRKKRKNFLANAKKYAKQGQLGRGTKMSEELYQYFLGILDAIKQGIHDTEERQALVNNVLERTKDKELDITGNQLGCRVIELLLPYSAPEDLERYMEILSPELRRLCSDNFSSHVVETLLRVACERATEHLQGQDNDQVSDSEDDVPKKKPKLEQKESKYSQDHVQKCYEFTMKICKYALNNLEDFVWDQYANHILRSAMKCLSGITLLPGEKPKLNLFKETVLVSKGIPPHLTQMNYKLVPDEFKELVKEFANRLSAWPQFKDLPNQNITSALLQVLLYALKNVDKHLTRDLIKKLLNESFAPEDWVATETDEKKDDKTDVKQKKKEFDDTIQNKETSSEDAMAGLPPVFKSESSVRLLEAALFVAKKKTYTQLYARCFINRLGQLVTLPALNFTVQRLIDNVKVKEEFEPMFEEIGEQFGALLACGNTGVLVALAKACLRLQARQAQFLANLEAALNCSSPETQKHFAVCCLRMLPLDRIDLSTLDKEYFINIHGSVILQTVLDFQRPAKAVSSLLELTPEQLMVVLCDAKGCHVADAISKGRCVGVKARDKLISRLKVVSPSPDRITHDSELILGPADFLTMFSFTVKVVTNIYGCYQKLALSQYGSRAFEQVFNAASLEQKVKIMSEISDKSNLLNGSQYGRLVASKLDVATFKISQKKWEEAWKKREGKK